MSLLDDVSLMITPNGVAEDVLFGVLPQPIIGTEEITNGDFASDSNWSITNNTGTDSEITGGYLRIKTDGAYTAVSQSGVTVADKQYKLVYTVLSSDGGNLAVVTIGNIASSIPSSVGTHTYYFTSESTSLILKRRSGALDVIIDNVSVREYTSADMDFTRATTATRSAYSVNTTVNPTFDTSINIGTAGSGWQDDSTGGSSASFSGGGGKLLSNGSDTVRLVAMTDADTSAVVVSGTTYKLTYDVIENNGVPANKFSYYNGSATVQISETVGSYELYYTASGTVFQFQLSDSGMDDGDYIIIDNVYLYELLIEEVPRNLFTYSEDFTSWSKSGTITTTVNYGISPNGTQDSTRVVFDSSDNAFYKLSTHSANTETNSIYVKGVTGETIKFGKGTTVNSGSLFTLTGDWQRIEFVSTTGNQFTINTYTSATARDIEIWGAQVEIGSQATTYIYTTDRLNVPRLDYTGGGCPYILSEPQRTNLLDDGNAAASLTGVTVTNTTSPEGIANALKLTETTANSQHFATISEATVSSGSVYTMSIFVKKGTQSSVTIHTQSSKIDSDITVDLDAGSVSAPTGADVVAGSGAISNYGNGWYRVSWSATASGTGAMSIYATVKGLSTYTGSTSEYTEYFGGQVELGSYPTSYIPTSGSTVTRNSDIFERTGIADLINSAEGVLYVEIAALDDDQTGRKISLNDGTINNSVLIGYTSVSNEIKTKVNSGGSSTANMNFTATDILSYIKIAIKWKVNDFAMWVNGVEVVTDNSGAAPIGLTKLSFDRGNGAENFRGKVRNLQVYKTALSDTQLDDLTS